MGDNRLRGGMLPQSSKLCLRRVTPGYLLAALAGLLGTAMALLATARYGIGLTPDSAAYVSAARSLAAGTGFTVFGGAPLLFWAPGFPMLLALIALGLPVDVLQIARFVNAAAFGLLVAASVCWLRRQKVARGYLIWGAVAVLLSPPIFKQSVVALSDMVFALFTLLFLAQMGEFLVTGRRREFACAAIFAAMACLVRYSAPAVIVTGCLLLLVQPGKSLRSRVSQALLFAVVSGMGIAAWLARNYILTSTLTGPRSPSADSLGDSIRLTLNTITSWVLPSRVLCGLWLAFPLWGTLSAASYAINIGPGDYPEAQWQNSQLIAYLKEHVLDGPVYTNEPSGVYLLTGLSTNLSPYKHGYYAPDSPGEDPAHFAASLPPVSYLAWFAGRDQDWLYSPEELRSVVDLAPVAEFADGTIYHVQALHQ